MRSPESFDAFYVSTRDRLLHETYALTGDIAASRTDRARHHSAA